jgi:hypothetical protein
MKTRDEALQEAAQDIINNFNISRCLDAMHAVDWKWYDTSGDRVTFSEFSLRLKHALNETIRMGSYSSGGFDFYIEESLDDDDPWITINGGFYMEQSIMKTTGGVYYQKESGSPWEGSIKLLTTVDDNDGWIVDRLPSESDGYNRDQFEDGDVWVTYDSDVFLMNWRMVATTDPWRPVESYEPSPFNTPRWKPNDGENYYFISDTFTIKHAIYHEFDQFYNHYDCGNCFETEEEADAVLRKITSMIKY